MKSRKTSGYRNYGLIPANEYTAKIEKNTNSTAVLEYDPVDNVELKRRLLKRRAQHQFRTRSRSRLRTRSTNGWRAEAASQQDETTGIGVVYK